MLHCRKSQCYERKISHLLVLCITARQSNLFAIVKSTFHLEKSIQQVGVRVLSREAVRTRRFRRFFTGIWAKIDTAGSSPDGVVLTNPSSNFSLLRQRFCVASPPFIPFIGLLI